MIEGNQIPKEWLQTNLGSIVEYGKTQKCRLDDVDSDTWVLELEDVQKESSKLLKFLNAEERPFKSTKNIFKENDVLYGKLRPYLNKVAIAPKSGVCTTEIIPLDSEPYVDNRYLFYWLKGEQFLSYVTEVSYGVNMPRLGTKDGIAAPFTLPPLEEQKVIVDKLDSLLAQVETTKARLDRVPHILKRFRQSVLAAAVSGRLTEEWRDHNTEATTCGLLKNHDPLPRPARWKSRSQSFIAGDNATAVGKPDKSPVKEWNWVQMVDVARMESGHTPSRSKPEYWGGDICWIGIKDANSNHTQTIIDTEQKTNDMGLANSASRLLPAGTVCISRTASVGYVVKLGKPMATSQDFVNWVPTNIINSDWLKWLFVAEKKSLLKFGKGSTHTTVYFPEWLSLHILLPHIDEQTEIVRRVEELFTFADAVEQKAQAASERVNKLTQSILAKAFRGELTADWRAANPGLISGENSAEALLEKIQAEREALKPKKKARAKKVKG